MKLKNLRGLVLFCIDAEFCVQIRIFQHSAISTHSAFCSRAKFSKFRKLSEFFPKNFDKLFSREYLILAEKMFDFNWNVHRSTPAVHAHRLPRNMHQFALSPVPRYYAHTCRNAYNACENTRAGVTQCTLVNDTCRLVFLRTNRELIKPHT